jgi:chemotaxis protein methyltransferase CheR
MSLSERLAALRSNASAASQAASGGREFAFSAADFERIRKLIYAKAGIALSAAKQDMVYSRLARRLRATGIKTFGEYLDHLEKAHSAAEWEAFINSLTTNLTSFYREAHHFPILADHLKKVAATRKDLRIWCCAASTGEEPYSIAMTVADAFLNAGINAPKISIVCSDLDTNVLATARKGEYFADRVDKIPPEQLHRYFTKTGTGADLVYAARPELKRMMSFQRINLLDSSYSTVRPPLDAIFCRNVMIYFDKPTQYKILQRFAPLLQPDGLLFAGHSESFLFASDLFCSLGKTVYGRVKK